MPTADTARPHAAIVYNPVKIPLDRIRLLVEAEERRLGWAESHWHPTSDDDSGRSAAEAALAGEPSVIIVGGGDGTVRTVAEVVEGHGVPVALLPSGTGNLLARNLGLPLNDPEASVRTAFGGSSRAVDVAVADLEDDSGVRTRRVFLVMAGIGLDAEMAEHTSARAKRRVGWLAYVRPIAHSIVANRLFHLHYRVDGGRARSSRAHTVIVGNCGTLTGNMLLIPAARIDDGLLDVVMLRPKGRFGWAGIGTRLTLQGIAHRTRLGRSLLRLAPDLRALVYAQGRQFEVGFDTPHGVELDGDSFGRIIRARTTIRPGALQVCVDEAA